MKTELDQLARLLILDGAFGSSFSKGNLRRGLLAAKQEIGCIIHPGWTDPGNSGVYDFLRSTVAKALPKDSLVTPDDVMQNALAGISREGAPCQNPFTEAGRRLKSWITPSSAPLSFAKKRLVSWMWRKAQNEHRGAAQRLDESFYKDPLLTDPQTHSTPFEQLTEAFKDPSDPKGQEIRDHLRTRFSEGTAYRKYADYMMAHLERYMRLPTLKEMSVEFDIKAQSLIKMRDEMVESSRLRNRY